MIKIQNFLMQVQDGLDQRLDWWLHQLIKVLHRHTSTNLLANTHSLIQLTGKFASQKESRNIIAIGQMPVFSFSA